MKIFKRLVGLLLCLAMVLSFVPASIVSAAESGGATTQNTTTSDVLEKINLSGTVVGACSIGASGTDYANYKWYSTSGWAKPWSTAMVDDLTSTTLDYTVGTSERADYYLNLTGGEGGYTTVDKIVMYHGGTTAVSTVTITLVLADDTTKSQTFTPNWGASADVDPITWTLEQTCNVKGVYVYEPNNTSSASFGDIEMYHYIQVNNLETATLNGVDLEQYKIVYSEDDLSYAKTAAEYIQKQILLRTGRQVEVVDDSTAESTYEILVGETNRSYSESISAPDEVAMKFTFASNGTKIAMKADYFIIAGAAYYFIDTYIGTTNFEATANTGVTTQNTITKEAKNYIFMIGDGMGEMHTRLFEKYGAAPTSGTYGYSDGEEIFYGYYLPYLGWQKTANISGEITDSAAAGTALATGYKTINGYIGKDQYLNDVKNLSELAMEQGKSVAIMSTEGVDGATPAAFSSHSDGRYNDDEIVSDQATFGGLLIDGYTNYNAFTAAEYATWEPLVKAGLNSVAGDSDGFFIMYEEAHIDKVSHRLDSTSSAGYTGDTSMETLWRTVYRFNQAIGIFMEYALYNPETMLLITADHETAGLDSNWNPTEENPEDEQVYGSVWNHSLKDVPVFSYGYGAEIFDDVTAENASYARTWAHLMTDGNAGDFGNPAYPIIGSGESGEEEEEKNYYIDLPEDAKLTDLDTPTFGYYDGDTKGEIIEYYKDTNPPENLIDGRNELYAESKTYTYTELADGTKVPVILFEFGSAVNIAGITLAGYQFGRYNIEDFDVEVYCHDDYSTSWYRAATVRDAFTTGTHGEDITTPLEIGFPMVREATKLRIIVKSITDMSDEGDGTTGDDALATESFFRIREIAVYETEASASTGVTMEPIASSNTPTPTVGYYSDNNTDGDITEYYDPEYPPVNLVDDNTSTQCRTDAYGYFYEELETGAKIPVYLFEFASPRAFTGVQIDTYKAMYYGIEDFTVQVYTEANGWVTATTVSDSFGTQLQESIVDPETYPFAEPIYGTKLRILVDKIWNMYDWRYDDNTSEYLVERAPIRLREITLMEDPDYELPAEDENRLKAPASLTATYISATEITVVAPASTQYPEAVIQYSIYLNGVPVKTNTTGVFDELKVNTTYTVYAKYLGDDKTWLDSYTTVNTAATDKLNLPAPDVEATLGTTSITVTADPIEGGELVYRLLDENHIAIQGMGWSTTNEFTGLTPNTKYTIQVKYDGDENHYDSEITELPVVLGKVLLTKPTLTVSGTTSDTITLNALAPVTGGSAEYSYSLDGTNWTTTTDPVITGLDPNTTYYLRARYVASNDSYNSSLYSETVTATTQKIALPLPNLTVTETTDSSITVTADAVTGGTLKFRINGGAWRTSGTFAALTRNTTYTIEAMYVADEDYIDSGIASIQPTTKKTPLSAPVLTVTETTESSITVTADPVVGGTLQYRIDGGKWQTSNVFTGLDWNTTYTVEAMYVADEGYINSDVTAISATTEKPSDPAAGQYAYLEAIPESGVTPHVGYNNYPNHEMYAENTVTGGNISDAMFGTVTQIRGDNVTFTNEDLAGYKRLSIVYDLNNGATLVGGVELTGGDYNLTKCEIQVKNTKGVWQTVKFVTNDLFDISEALRNDTVLITFTPVTGTHVRLLINGYEENANNAPEIREMVIYEVKEDAKLEKKTVSSGTTEVFDENKANAYTGDTATLTFNEVTGVKRLKLFGDTLDNSIGAYTVKVQTTQGGDWTQVATGTAFSGTSGDNTCIVNLDQEYEVYGVQVISDSGTVSFPEIEVYGYKEAFVPADPNLPDETPTDPTERPAAVSPVQTSPAATQAVTVPTGDAGMADPEQEQPDISNESDLAETTPAIPTEPVGMTEPTTPVATQATEAPVISKLDLSGCEVHANSENFDSNKEYVNQTWNDTSSSDMPKLFDGVLTNEYHYTLWENYRADFYVNVASTYDEPVFANQLKLYYVGYQNDSNSSLYSQIPSITVTLVLANGTVTETFETDWSKKSSENLTWDFGETYEIEGVYIWSSETSNGKAFSLAEIELYGYVGSSSSSSVGTTTVGTPDYEKISLSASNVVGACSDKNTQTYIDAGNYASAIWYSVNNPGWRTFDNWFNGTYTDNIIWGVGDDERADFLLDLSNDGSGTTIDRVLVSKSTSGTYTVPSTYQLVLELTDGSRITKEFSTGWTSSTTDGTTYIYDLDKTYTVNKIYVWAKNCSSSVVFGEFELQKKKAVQLDAPENLQATSVAEDSITVAANTLSPAAAGTLKYRINAGEWTTNPTFTGLTAGTSYTIDAMYVAADGYIDSGVSTITVTTTAPTIYTVSGTTTAGATVQLCKDGAVVATTTADGSGNYSFADVSIGNYTLVFYKSAYEAQTAVITVSTANVTQNITLTQAIYTVSGTATTGATIQLYQDGAVVATATATNGSYSFSNVALGNYTLVATKYGYAAQTAVVTVNKNVTQSFALTQMLYTVSGTVTGSTNDAATVKLYQDGVLVNSTTADANGAYTFSNVEIGNYSILVQKGKHIAQSATVTVSSANVTQNFTMSPVSMISTNVVIDASFGVTYNVRLYEPWALRVNITFGTSNSATPLSNFKSYGAYAIIGYKYGDGTTAPASWEDIISDPDAVQFKMAAGEGDGNMFATSSTTATFDFYDGLYTYRLAENVYWVAYYEDTEGTIHFTEVKNPVLMDKVTNIIEKISGDEEQDTQRIVLEHMKQLHYALIDFRGADAEFGQEYADGKYLGNVDMGAVNNGTYQFGKTHKIRLIEPWSVKVSYQVRNKTTATMLDFADATDYGVIFYHDKTGEYYGSMSAAQMLARKDAVIYSKGQGNITLEDGKMIAVYDKYIFTYEMKSDIYCLPFVVVDGEYHYASNASRIYVIDQMYAYYNNTILKNEERLTFKAMIQLYESTTIHRKKYGK